MCGRFYVKDDTYEEAARLLGTGLPASISAGEAGDRMPGALALAVVGPAELAFAPLFWGFPKPEGSGLLINARAETVREKRSFAESFTNRRCVLPAAGFYEWDAGRNKVRFSVQNKRVIFLAGIYRGEPGTGTYVVLTTPANDSMAPVHDRMPLILTPEEVPLWTGAPDLAGDLLAKTGPELTPQRDYQQLSLFDL